MAKKQAVLASSDLKNPSGLGKQLLEPLLNYLGHLAEIDADVAARTARYVVDDADAEVLLQLGGQSKAAKALGLSTGSHNIPWQKMQSFQKERAAIFSHGMDAPPALWLRLGEVFDAVYRAAGHKIALAEGWSAAATALVSEVLIAWSAEGYDPNKKGVWSADMVEAVLNAAGLPLDLFARVALDPQGVQHFHTGHYGFGGMIAPFSGWARYLARHVSTVRAALARIDAESRCHVLRVLSETKFDITPIVDLLVEVAVGSSKTAREAALPLLYPHRNLTEHRDAARPHVEKYLAEGDAGQRHEAAQLLWRLYGTDATAQLRKHLEWESSDRVKQTIERLLAAPTGDGAAVEQELAAQLPPIELPRGVVPISDEAKAGLRESFERAHQAMLKQYEQQLASYNAPNRPQWMQKPTKPEPLGAAIVEKLIHYVEGRTEKLDKANHIYRVFAWNRGPLGDWLAPPGVQLIHVVRLAHAFDHAHVNPHHGFGWHQTNDLEAYRARCQSPFDLRTLDAVVATLPGARPGLIAEAYLASNTKYHSFCDWEAEAIWPAFAEHPEVLRNTLTPSVKAGQPRYDYTWPEKRRNAFRVLAMFPQLPPAYVPLLWDLALGESKADRPLAQAALATVPDKASKVLVALGDGRQGARAAAAEWLGKIGDPSAIEPLKEAFRKEKQEVVRGAVMSALDALGADVNEFLDRGALHREAEAGLAKKRPRGMEWVPLDALPALHWADTGKSVDPQVVQWWVVQSIQQKSPVAGPLLRRYLALCRPHEAAALAKFVLAAWIGQDSRTMTHDESAAKAKEETDRQWAMFSKHQYWIDHYKNDKENLYRQLLQQFQGQLLGSANDQKGMLALVCAAGDGDCVKLAEQYIRKWFGQRLAQCKALVEILAWIKHPLAIQALLGFANRFRTKAIRQLAGQHVQALAEREGWTIDELADRTIPDAGFARPTDESGQPIGDQATLTLDYGGRTFTVRLGDRLEPVIANADGKTVKSPPAPGKSDDAEKVKEAKKAFTDAKKVVKEVVKRQAERFYEAVCTQRTWAADDWRRYLVDHPIVGKLCTRLAWLAHQPTTDDGERFLGCFRPLEDGSLTNENDEAITLPDGAMIRLAHTGNTPAELGTAWQQHFADYDVEPLFAQFGRPTYTLPEGKKNETDVKDFEGHVLTTFKLRGKATKLGYVRGEAEDGGWFYQYRKPFSSLGLQVVIEFTGSPLPEEDNPCALTHLYFTAVKGDREVSYSWQPAKLPLSKVPPVLLSECYNDMRQMAAEGSGYDPKWQDRNYY